MGGATGDGCAFVIVISPFVAAKLLNQQKNKQKQFFRKITTNKTNCHLPVNTIKCHGRWRPGTVGSTAVWHFTVVTPGHLPFAAEITWQSGGRRFRCCGGCLWHGVLVRLQREQLRLNGGQELLGPVGEEVVRVKHRRVYTGEWYSN